MPSISNSCEYTTSRFATAPDSYRIETSDGESSSKDSTNVDPIQACTSAGWPSTTQASENL